MGESRSEEFRLEFILHPENNIALELAEPERDDLDEPINREEATDADSDSFEHLEDLARDNPDVVGKKIEVVGSTWHLPGCQVGGG